ncbi:hypothetical protein CEQ90_07795 [Lewinellaceae bacterium SD302]|nr:hypothetical protein CEQ90_07795 [Lewinellaceae bacterium SD302]
MKAQLLILFLLSTQILAAQTFTEMTGTPFKGVSRGSIAFSDVNGDGHEDVLITGNSIVDVLELEVEPIAKLYTNDGSGNFTEMTDTPFEGVWVSSIAFSDVNGDSYEDVLITGENHGNERIAKLYTNDGSGNFTEMTDTPFEGVATSSIAFSDVNGDGYQDVLITGRNNVQDEIAKLYTNDGSGNFTEMTDTPFEGVRKGSIAFSDVNSDGFQDVLITGLNTVSEGIAKLYTNDGWGNFTEVTGAPFEGVKFSSIAFSDVDGNGHEDVLITGRNDEYVQISKLYTNGGARNFTRRTVTPFEGISSGSIAFSDINGDCYEDVLITGSVAKLYTNDGSGNFTEMTGMPFDRVWYSSIVFSDVNGDGHQDVLIAGERWDIHQRIAKLYINDGSFSTTAELNTACDLEFLPYPNPSTSSTLFIPYNAVEMGEATIKVYNLNGALLRQQSELIARGQQILPIDISSLNPGTYLIELQIGEERKTATFVVQ